MLKTAHERGELSRYGDVQGMIDLAGDANFAPDGLNLANLYNTVGKKEWLCEVLEKPMKDLPPWDWHKIALSYTTFTMLKDVLLKAYKEKRFKRYASLRGMLDLAANKRFENTGLNLVGLYGAFGTRARVAKMLKINIEEVPREWRWRQISISPDKLDACKEILLEAYRKNQLSQYANLQGMLKLAATLDLNLHHLHSAFPDTLQVAAILGIPEARVPKWGWRSSFMPIERALRWIACIQNLKGPSGKSFADIQGLMSQEVTGEKEKRGVEILVYDLTRKQRQQLLDEFGTAFGIGARAPFDGFLSPASIDQSL